MWVLAILAAIVGVLILVVVAMLMGPLVGPLYDVVSSSEAVQQVGFMEGVDTAMLIGGALTLPLLGLSMVIWFQVMRLRRDTFLGQTRR